MTEEFLRKSYEGKKIFITGHTGFKGSWMIQVFKWLGADVRGYALSPQKECDLFNQINGDKVCDSIIGDIMDLPNLKKSILEFQPDYLFHLAAQSSVLVGYNNPNETFSSNAGGTSNVLECLRFLRKKCVGIFCTTDKVYYNNELGIPFVESDRLGGKEPYGASKACAELIVESYRHSYFNVNDYNTHLKSIATVRAGNSFGGGDFTDDRIIPDIVRCVYGGTEIFLRHPKSIRPWQHILEPIGGYIQLASIMYDNPTDHCSSYNFGPNHGDVLSVEKLTSKFISYYDGHVKFNLSVEEDGPYEAKLLLLDSTKSKNLLGWVGKLNIEESIEMTASWYFSKENANKKCLDQIKIYFNK